MNTNNAKKIQIELTFKILQFKQYINNYKLSNTDSN